MCVCVCVCVSTAPSVCALGWVKYREHISLLVILCIIVYVTNKKNKENSCQSPIVDIVLRNHRF